MEDIEHTPKQAIYNNNILIHNKTYLQAPTGVQRPVLKILMWPQVIIFLF